MWGGQKLKSEQEGILPGVCKGTITLPHNSTGMKDDPWPTPATSGF